MITFTDEDVILVRKFIEIRNKGHYAVSTQLTEVYNRVLNKHVNNTNCSSCIRQRINELEQALRKWEREKQKKELAQAIKEHEEAVEELNLNAELELKGFLTEEEEPQNADKHKSQPTKGRKKKSK